MASYGLESLTPSERKFVKRLLFDFTELMRERREGKGWTQQELSEKVGAEVESIRLIEIMNRPPSLNMLCRIARVLNIKISLS